MTKSRTLRVAGTVAALAAVGAVVAGGTIATADVAKGPESVIKIKGNGHPRFDAPEEVPFGADLQIVNKTDPDKIGPHTFSLVEKEALPKGKDELKRCEKIKDVCKDIFNAHEIVFEPFSVGEPNVENGVPGWDATFDGGSQEGDSWFTAEQDETTSRTVATPNTMRFLCIVHPDMQGKVKVLPIR